MRKITDFIVEKRKGVFLVFILLTIGSLFLAQRVNINRDINKYLPKDSAVRQGLDIMEEEFAGEETSTLNLMFKDLTEEEKNKIKSELEDISHVEEVAYDNTENYNKDGYTLYILTADVGKDSREAKTIYNDVVNKYAKYFLKTSGDIADENKVVLPTWIVGVAIGSALIILIIMCDSYIEPFLFLTSIGMGVFLNKGTNIIFPSISSITNSIAAILQLALSMDYSIMLINRYRQEKEKNPDNIEAMKEALYKSFTSISSSSVTTIVGLLALVFISFTIGRDLGFVLAKGVLFSLLSIFTCLPMLILTFDNLITKTHKKCPNIKLDGLGKLVYKFHGLGALLFIIVFIVSFLLKGNLGFLFTDNENDEIQKVFNPNNQMAIIYANKNEKIINNYCQKLEQNNYLNDVLCYGNTLNKATTYDKLNSLFTDLGVDTSVDDYLLKIIYYNYYNKDTANKITFPEFINFIKSDIYANPEMNEKIDDEMRQNIDTLNNFTNISLANKKRTLKEIATTFKIEEDTVQDLLIYYNSLNTKTTMTVQEFVNFINNYLLKSKYKDQISKENLASLDSIKPFLDKNTLNKEINSNDMAKIIGKSGEDINNIYLYYIIKNEPKLKLTIKDYIDFVLNEVATNPNYQSSFNQDTVNKLNLLKNFTNQELLNTPLDIENMANLYGLDLTNVEQIYFVIFNSLNEDKHTLKEIEAILPLLGDEVAIDPSIFSNIPEEDKERALSAIELANLTGIPAQEVQNLYTLISYKTNPDAWVMTPLAFSEAILNSDILKAQMDSTTQSNLTTLYNVADSTLKNTTYTYQELSSILNIDLELNKKIYSLYEVNGYQISPYNFLNFLLANQDDETLNLDQATITNLTISKNISEGTLANSRYSYANLAKLLNMDKDKLKLLYSLYDINYKNKSISLSYSEFVNFLLDDVLTNKEYKANFSEDKITKIKSLKTIISDSVKQTKYTKEEIIAILTLLSDDVEKDLIDLLYIYYGSENNFNNAWTMTVEQFVNYLNDDILTDERFTNFLQDDLRNDIKKAKTDVNEAKNLLVGKNYSRVVLNTKYPFEDQKTYSFLTRLNDDLGTNNIYVVGNSAMSFEMTKTFASELNFITFLTALFIFVVVAITFKSLIIPFILVVLIQTAVYITMGILSFQYGNVYFISLLIVQSILMGATIDYAILYTSYYLEARDTLGVKEAIINAYNKSINTIITSASILSIVTLIIGYLGSATASKICLTISKGTICSTLLILFLLPPILATLDKILVKKSHITN